MNEHSYTRAVLKFLPDEIHVQSMTSASLNSNGTPDRYIDGPAGDLWVEFKFLPRPPKILRPYELLSELQMQWLKRRSATGNNAIVVVGFKVSERRSLGLILPDAASWSFDHAREDYMPRLLPNNEVSNYLLQRVTCQTSPVGDSSQGS